MTDKIEFAGRAWPRSGAQRFEFSRQLAERTHVEGKAAIQAAERALAEAVERSQAASLVPAEHEAQVARLLRDELQRDARKALAGPWQEYRTSGTGVALVDLCGALRAMRGRELQELGEASTVVVEAVLAVAGPGVRTYTDAMLVLVGQCLSAALNDSRLALRDALGMLERLLMAANAA